MEGLQIQNTDLGCTVVYYQVLAGTILLLNHQLHFIRWSLAGSALAVEASASTDSSSLAYRA